MYRQENVNLAHRELAQKDQTRAKKCREFSLHKETWCIITRIGEHEILWSSVHGKDIPMHTEETGKNCNKCHVISGILQNQCIDVGMFMASSMKAPIHLGPDFFKNSAIYKNTRFENIQNVFNIIQKFIKQHSEETLNVRSLDYSSPSWTRSTLINE